MTRLCLLLFVSLCLSPLSVAHAQVTDGCWWVNPAAPTTQQNTCPTLMNQLRQIFVTTTDPWLTLTRSAIGPLGPLLWREETARAPGSNSRQ